MAVWNNLIVDKTEEFALRIIKLYSYMQKNREYILSKQVLRSGTSIGANIAEAIAAQSSADFIHKVSISLKEAHETKYWMILMQKSQLVPGEYKEIISECDSIIRILSKILITSKERKG